MTFDVAIVGAGPAGAWAAYRLARGGVRVSLVDGSHPREKPCGGGVTGRALALVGDAIDCAALPVATIGQACFAQRELSYGVRVPLSSGSLVVASRAAFDRALLEAAVRAGATLHASRALDVAVERDGVRVDTREGTIRAEWLIGADGANSLVRRRVAAPFRRDQLSVATGAFARGV